MTEERVNNQSHRNAIEILEAVKDGRGESVDKLLCTCKKKSLVARFYSCPDDEGEICTWVVLSTFKLKGRKIPSAGIFLPSDPSKYEEGTFVTALPAVCPECRKGWLICPSVLFDTTPLKHSLPKKGDVLAARFGLSENEPIRAGQNIETFTYTGDWKRGPLSTIIFELDPPNQSVLAKG